MTDNACKILPLTFRFAEHLFVKPKRSLTNPQQVINNATGNQFQQAMYIGNIFFAKQILSALSEVQTRFTFSAGQPVLVHIHCLSGSD